MSPQKTCCLWRTGPQFGTLGLQPPWKTVSASTIEVNVYGVWYWAEQHGNAGMAKHIDGRLRLQLAFGWLVIVQAQEADLKGVVRYFVKKRDTNLTETNLSVAREIETSHPTQKRPFSFIDACQIPNFSHYV